jgi:valyl-tRNA synthetase/predicted alpha/beta hydrolase family esterase
MPLSPNYNPKDNETQIYSQWMDAKIGKPEKQYVTATTVSPQKGVKTHAILMPPPNLTGDLHAGHAFQHYLMDTLSRLARQRGEKNLWFPGVDHAGLQLEGVIDKLIKKGEFDEEIKRYFEGNVYDISQNPKGIIYKTFYPSLHATELNFEVINLQRNWDEEQLIGNKDYKDEEFNPELVRNPPDEKNLWEKNAKSKYIQNAINHIICKNREELPKYLKTNHPDIWLECTWSKVNLWRDNQKNQSAILGDTPDYERTLFTLDPHNLEMVYYAFTKYWQDGLIYKGSYLVNWSVGLQTALSDVAGEIDYEKRVDPFVTFEFGVRRFEYTDYSINEKYKDLKIKPCKDWKRPQLSTVRPETKFTDIAVAMHPSKFPIYFNQDIFEESNSLNSQFLDDILDEKIFVYYELPPLHNNELKLIFTEKVDPNFGTGIMKITPAHDPFDYELCKELVAEGKLQHFRSDACIGRDGKLTSEFAGEFAGMIALESRGAIFKKLIETGYIPKKENFEGAIPAFDQIPDNEFWSWKQDKQYEWLKTNYPQYDINWNYEHNVTICERTKTVVEPLISEEFFISYHKEFNWTPIAKDLSRTITSKGKKTNLQKLGIEAVNATNFHSPEYKERGINFLENIKDWCISRDLIWGHKMPVWYNLETNPDRRFYSYEELQADPPTPLKGELNMDFKNENQNNKPFEKVRPAVARYQNNHFAISVTKPTTPGNWVQEEKILDTWFSSCLWPLSTLKYPEFVRPNYSKEIPLLRGSSESSGVDCMTVQPNLVFLGGGDVFETQEDYQSYLHDSRIRLDSTTTRGWRSQLQTDLKAQNIELIAPRLPSKDNAKYADWKIIFDKLIPFINSNSILVGHSLGGSFLLKYLSENNLSCNSIHLLGTPKTGCFDFDTNDFDKLQNLDINIYHSKDDFVVDYNKALELTKILPNAKFNSFENYNHFLIPSFPELTNNILSKIRLEKQTSNSDFQTFYPTQQLVTGKDIFYQWIVRMTVLSYYFTAEVPYYDLVVHPTILDDKGKKMSKSLGNGMDPVAQINKYSSDAMRMTMLGNMIPGRNTKMGGRIADELCEKYRNFGNKMWNVARFFEYQEKDINK